MFGYHVDEGSMVDVAEKTVAIQMMHGTKTIIRMYAGNRRRTCTPRWIFSSVAPLTICAFLVTKSAAVHPLQRRRGFR